MNEILNFRSPKIQSKSIKYAVALCRVSTEDQFTKGLSVPEQRQRIQKWADEHNVTILKWVELHHSAYRGLDEDPEVLELLEYAKNNDKVSLFLVDEKSRFARRKYLRVVWQEELRRHGVTVIGVSEPQYDRNSIHGIWLEGISETKDEARSIETAYHTVKGMTRNAGTRDPETGYCYKNGGIAPDGYINKRVIRGKDSRGKDITKLLWEIDEKRSWLIRYMILELWYRKKMSYRDVRDHLNTKGTEYQNREGRPWSVTTIREICMRALEGVYSGLYYWNRTGRDLRGTGQKWKDADDWVIIENAHPAIITQAEWQELKEVMGPLVEKRKRNIIPTRTEDSPYLFSGENAVGEPMFVCLNCGGPMNSQQMGKHRYMYYVCANFKNKGKAGCNKAVALRKEEVEGKVLAAIKSRFTPQKIKVIVREMNEILKENNNDLYKAENHLQKSIIETENAINNILAAIQEGKDSKVIPLLLSQLEKLQEEKQTLETELEEIQKESPKVDKIEEATILAQVQNLESILMDSTTSNHTKRMAVRSFIRQLRFNPDTGEIYVYFWHDPTGQDIKRLMLMNGNNQNKKEDESSSSIRNELSDNVMKKGGAGNRNRTGMGIATRRILSPVRLPVALKSAFLLGF
ncbi:recombinase family protein [Biomaibacter acetigenes]|uniref:Recombinase family protein n=1 Tax=Biomaibacter acetigenes TaxID=2316383 RepID=A0A3G2R608_9FIRM|nr:recombinase family protein [Biomaibacter acetigenes]AYO30849.1 recombinase family protein [Biomaibacter acetigenes]